MKLLQLPNPGEGGRLGNQIFAIASTIGLALRHGYTPRFPANWKYRQHFNIPDEWFGEMSSAVTPIKEPFYEYCGDYFRQWLETDYRTLSGTLTIIHSYLQSQKYWAGYEDKIRQYLTPKGAIPQSDESVCIHYRRGDYLRNPNYKTVSVDYTIGVYSEYFYPMPIKAFSDDYEFIKLHHDGDILPQQDEIKDLISMVNCRYHIISNSTFSWWAAYLSGGFTIYPPVWFDGALAGRASTETLFPDGWVKGEYKKAYLNDVTFIIPVSYDHPDRCSNLETVVQYINQYFYTNIIIGEINTKILGPNKSTEYMRFDFAGQFHRTKALNEMTKAANTPYVVGE